MSEAVSLKTINTPEETFAASVPTIERKKLSQFFTPVAVAEFMAQWIVSNPSCKTVLDPAIGLGIFFRTIQKLSPSNHYKFVGYDIDKTVLEKATDLFSTNDVEFRNEDYLFNDWGNFYDGIICNPPYLKFQDYKNRRSSLTEFQSRLDMNLSGFTNIYSMFMLKSVNQLSVNGRAAYLIPSEFLNADYGTTIKKLLLENGSLRFVILFDAKENVFDDALTTSCILLFSNDDKFKTVTFINAGKVSDLSKLSEQIANYPDVKISGKTVFYSDLDPDVKWRKFYQKQNGEKFKNLIPLSAYGKVVRGIATGDNDYFTFDEKKKEAFGIEDKFLLPCLTKAIHADKNFFTQEDFDKLRKKGSRTFLFNAFDTTNKAVQEYIALGEKLEVNTRYLTSHRNPWYAIEHRPPAPILITVFNRNGLRFVKNETRARNLTCFHCFYLNLFASQKQDLLMAYFLTDVSTEVLNDNRREYGGGLNKFEPNDLNKANVINLDAIDEKTEREIVEAYQEYRLSVLQSAPDLSLLKNLNEIYLGILI